jgi:hypothetical protein
MKTKPSIAYHLGYYVGIHLINRYLPTLSVDEIKDKNGISVTYAEGKEYRRLTDDWFNTRNEIERKILFEKANKFHNVLINKYIPPILKCHIYNFNLDLNSSEILDFKEGISYALWDFDFCYYKVTIDDIIFDGDSIILERINFND